MKKIIAMLLALAMVVGWIAIPPAHAHAEEVTQEDNAAVAEPLDPTEVTEATEPEIEWKEYPETAYSYSTQNGEAEISGLRENIEGYVALPATLDGYPVTGIAASAFESKTTGLTGVAIPDSVTEIGHWAFGSCTGLTTLVLGSGLETIGMCAFNGCSALKEVTIPKNVTLIGNAAFAYCSALKAFHVEKGNTAYWSDDDGVLYEIMTHDDGYDCQGKIRLACAPGALSGSYTVYKDTVSIFTNAFASCVGLTEVILPESLTGIGKDAFSGCTGLMHVDIPNSVSVIGSSAFSGCESLQDVTIGAAEIYDYAFYGCKCLESVKITDTVTSIGANAFEDCEMLTSVTVPSSVVEIGSYAFLGCVMLCEVILEEGITSIPSGCFGNCYGLGAITIPTSVTRVDSYAFSGCNLMTVFYAGTQEQWDAISIAETGNDALLNANLVQPDPCADGHVAEIIPGREPTDTEPGLTEGWVCANCGMILKPQEEIPPVSEPSDPTTAPVKPSVDATEPSDAPIAPSVDPMDPTSAPTEPSEPEADWEKYLTFEPLGEEYYIVFGCDKAIVGELTIPATYNGLPVVSIGQWAFEYCEGLTSVMIPSSVTSIGAAAFRSCNSLKTVTIGGVEDIGEGAFCGCENLTDITVGDDLKNIGAYAFDRCEKLTNVYFDGTEEEWKSVIIGEDNSYLLNANIVFLGEGSTEPPVDPTDAPIEPTYAPIDPTEAPTEPSQPEEEQRLIFDLNEDGWSYRVSGCSEKIIGELIIPATYMGMPVTTIGSSALCDQYDMTSVVLPDTITVIDQSAFVNCHNLQSVNLPDGLVAIAEYAFASCDNLYEIRIPANVQYIGVGAFNACPLTGIWVDENNPNYANDEKGVLFSKDMTLLKMMPYGLTGSYAIPDGVEYISNQAFNNTRLSEVTFPDSVTEIGERAFNNCYLTEIVIGSGVKHIATDAFANCEYLTKVTVPNSVVVIADYAFQNSPNVTFYCHVGAYAATYADDFNIPVSYLDTVKEVSVATMPEKLVYPLDGHLKLAGLSLDVTLEDGTVVTIYNGYTVEPYDFSTAGTKTVTVSVNGVAVSFPVEVDDQLIEYPESDHPYQNNSNITWKFTYPGDADMLEITFSADTRVENNYDYIYIGDSEGNETGYTDTELAGKKIIVPGKVFTIRLTSDISAVEYGFAITSIEALKKVDLFALTFTPNADGTGYIVTDCDEAAEGVLEIPAEYEGLPVEGIGDNAFQNCIFLTDVTVAEGITYIGNGAFGYCSGLKEITIPVSITAIGDYAFLGCGALTDVHYGGNRKQWNAIQMGEGEALPDVNIHFSQVGCEHVPGEPVVVNEWGGSCFDTKYQDVVICCVDCGAEMERKTISLPPKGHTPGEPVIENGWGGSCTDYRQDQEVIRCTVCGEMISSKTVIAEPVGHIEGETLCYEEPASCTVGGYREWRTICSVCGYTMEYKVEDIPAAGHIPGEPVIVREEPTCRRSGCIWKTYFCVDCGMELNRIYEFLPATDHIPGEVQREVEMSVSCYNDGIYWDAVYCRDCGKTLSREQVVEKATGHSADRTEIYNERPASCSSAGRYDEATYCQCGMQIAYEVVMIPQLDHAEAIMPGYPATCTSFGMTDGKYCTLCGWMFVPQEWIDPLGHTEEIIPGYAATCTSEGMSDGRYCTVCGETTEWPYILPMLGHTPGDAVIENETETSYELVTYCSVCGEELSREYVESACFHGNQQTYAVETVPASCTVAGYTLYHTICVDCGEILSSDTDPIPAQGHTPDNAVIENESATSYDVVVYCVACRTELSRETIQIACTHENTTVTTEIIPATCIKPGSKTEIVTCADCGEELGGGVEEIPATGIHTYSNDNDAVCNECYFVRQMVDTYKFENYRVVYSDSDTTHKNPRAIIYKLGDQTVVDPSDEKALKAIDPSAETIWQASAINNILLTDAGNYVLLLKYNVGTATVSVPMVISVTADPKLIIDKNNKLTVIDNNGANINHRVVVYYLGDKTVDNIYDETALKAIDSAPQTVWQKSVINKLTLTKGGNYVLHLCYNVGTGAKQTVAQMFTVESIPTLAVNQNNMLVATEENAENKNHRVTVYYLGNKTVSDPFNETEVKNAAISTKTVWGLAEINKTEILEGGNYVFHMYYNVGTSAKRTLALEATLTERPKLSVSEDNKLVVEYSDASISNPRAYIYNVGDKKVDNIYDEAALQKIATPTQVWGLSSILRKQLTPGTYVIHLHYNVAGGAKSTVALKITIGS